MKKTLLLTIAAILIMGCGGVESKHQSNSQLGVIPAIYVHYNTQNKELKEKGRSGDIEHETWSKKEKELKNERDNSAVEALNIMKGKNVFFSIADGCKDDRFDIESIVIDDLAAETGALSLKVKVKATRTMESDYNANLNYIIIDEENQVIGQGSLNPFTKQPIISSRQFPVGVTINQGAYCCEEGTSLYLYCGSYNYTKFKQLIFIDSKNS